MKKYTIGLITGALLAVSAMMFMGAQNKNLGDITVNSITVTDDGSGGVIRTYNADGKQTVYLGTSGEGGVGFLSTYNADGKKTAYLGTSEGGFGFLSTYNKHEVMTGYFGTDINNDGMAVLSDRYGDIGWAVDGKK